MKKITKRIMALMLSLVMIFGCIPSFINEASATEINTIADVLATVDFPTSTSNEIPDKAWVSDKESIAYFSNGYVKLTFENNTKKSQIAKTNSVTSNDGGATYSYTESTATYKFVMTEGILTSIEVSGFNGNNEILNGTYEPVKTIADILATADGGFPTTDTWDNSPNDAWVSSEGKKLYKWDNNCLICFIGSNTRQLPALIENVDPTEDGYIFTDSARTTFKFVMTSDKLTSIIISNDTDPCDYVGTYEPVSITIADILDTVPGGFPTNSNYGWLDKVDGGRMFVDSGYLCVNGENMILLDVDATKGDGFYTASNGINFKFNMENDKLTSIEISDYNLNPAFNGTYIEGKTVTVTMPTTAGLTVEEIRNSATLTDSANTADFNNANIDSTNKRSIHIYGLKDDGTPNMSDKKASDYALEKDKEYMAVIQLKDAENVIHYKSVNVNDKTLYFSSSSTDAFFVQSELIIIKYIFTANDPQPAPSGGGSSKKYKAKDDKDTAEKVSGSGKKGSIRTITPIEGKKVSSVIVKDKDGNRVDVTLNEDGTYSFKQPASDVTIEVNYKNREITLNIGSTEAEVDGEKSNLDVCPVVRNDRTMLPIRYVAENLGAKVEWNEKKPDYVAITRGDTKIEITLGSDIMLVNGKEVKLDSVAFAENDRTYLPVRAISEALNAIVEWNEERPMEVKIYER